MMQAAEVDARGRIDGKLQGITKEAISKHVKVPAKDVVIVDVDYDGDADHLRHFVAVDHENRKIVLSIRGTFSLSEMVVDVAAFSRKFLPRRACDLACCRLCLSNESRGLVRAAVSVS